MDFNELSNLRCKQCRSNFARVSSNLENSVEVRVVILAHFIEWNKKSSENCDTIIPVDENSTVRHERLKVLMRASMIDDLDTRRAERCKKEIKYFNWNYTRLCAYPSLFPWRENYSLEALSSLKLVSQTHDCNVPRVRELSSYLFSQIYEYLENL